MILDKIGYSYNDITIVPKKFSGIKSRSEIRINDRGGYLPIFTAPMSSVINETNYEKFEKCFIHTVIPRSVDIETRFNLFCASRKRFIAFSLSEFEKYFCNEELAQTYNYYDEESGKHIIKSFNVCIDIANGHMKHLYMLCRKAKELALKYQYYLTIMTGNIANAETYKDICSMIVQGTYENEPVIDYIRVGIGSGAGCITSSNTAVHFPMASLIDECNEIKKHAEELKLCNVQIIADGGIRNYSDIIKALALGADYVMIGSLFAKCLESCGAKMFTNYKGEKEMTTAQSAYDLYEKGAQLYTRFYGMASADGQIAINHKKTKTAEGIVKMLPVEYKLHKWVENMCDYMRSAMSYCDCKKLDEFIGKQDLVVNSPGEQNAVNK